MKTFRIFIIAAAIFAGTWVLPVHRALATDPMVQATAEADARIDAFRNATDPVARRKAFLDMQADPIAVNRVNAYNKDLVPQANAELTAIRQPVIDNLKAELQKRYPGQDVQVVEFGKTPQSHPGEFGQDWDLTARVNGNDIRHNITQEIAHPAYLDSATTVRNPDGSIQKFQITDPHMGEAITANEFVHHQSIAVTSGQHADAYGTGKTDGQHFTDVANRAPGVDPGKLVADPGQMSKGMAYKSDEAFQRVPKQGEGWNLEGQRQATKQDDKFKVLVESQEGAKVPEFVDKGIDVLKNVTGGRLSDGTILEKDGRLMREVPQPDGTVKKEPVLNADGEPIKKQMLTPDQARAQLKEMGETPESIIRKNSDLFEAAQKLKSPEEIAKMKAEGRYLENPFEQNVKDQLQNKGIDVERAAVDKNLRDVTTTRDERLPSDADVQGARQKLFDQAQANGNLKGETGPGTATKPGEARPSASSGFEGEGFVSKAGKAGGKVLEVGGEVALGVQAYEFGKGAGQVITGEKTPKDFVHEQADSVSGGLKTKLDGASAGLSAVEKEQKNKDEARAQEIGKLLKDADPNMSKEDRLAIMAAVAKGDDSLLNKKLDECKARGIDIKTPDREMAKLQPDEGLQIDHGVVSGIPSRALDAVVGLVKGVVGAVGDVASIPYNAAGTMWTNSGDQDKARRLTDAELRDKLLATGASPEEVNKAFAAKDQGDLGPMNGLIRQAQQALKDDPMLEAKKRIEAQLLESHPELAQLSKDERDALINGLLMAKLEKPPPQPPPLAEVSVPPGETPTPTPEPKVSPTPETDVAGHGTKNDFDNPDTTPTPVGIAEASPPEPSPTESPDGVKNPKDFAISDGATGKGEHGSKDDFSNPDQGKTDDGGSTGGGTTVATDTPTNFDASAFARGQAKEDASQTPQKVQGDYAEAARLDSALRSAEDEMRRAAAEARRVAAQQRAAEEEAIRQQEMRAAQQRQYEAYQRWLAQKRAYDQWAAQQQWLAQQQQAQQDAYYQQLQQQRARQQPQKETGVIMDPPQ